MLIGVEEFRMLIIIKLWTSMEIQIRMNIIKETESN